jgi:hypothetical protein
MTLASLWRNNFQAARTGWGLTSEENQKDQEFHSHGPDLVVGTVWKEGAAMNRCYDCRKHFRCFPTYCGEVAVSHWMPLPTLPKEADDE